MRIRKLLFSYLAQPKYFLKNFKLRILKYKSNLNVVFVVGAPRSGTTLLHTLISSHSKCFTVQYETALFTWKNLFSHPHFLYSLEESQRQLNQANDLVEFFDTSVRKLKEFNQDNLFIEKTPQHINHLRKIKRSFLNAKFIVINRDVRDCYLSSYSVKTMKSFQDPNFFARYWNNCIKNGLNFKNDPSAYFLKYEDLVANSIEEMKKVMEFLGLELEDQQLDTKVYGNDIRADKAHFKMLNQEINTSSVARWKKEMSKDDKTLFKNKCLENLKKLNYQINL